MRNHEKQAEQFANIVKKAGGIVQSQYAGTGTVYVTVDGSFKARFADHGECYCREDVSVDPEGVTMLQALRACAKATGLDLSRPIASREAIERKKAEEASAYKAEMAAIEAAAEEKRAERVDTQRAALLARWPDYDTFPSKKQKRCRHKINQELGL